MFWFQGIAGVWGAGLEGEGASFWRTGRRAQKGINIFEGSRLGPPHTQFYLIFIKPKTPLQLSPFNTSDKLRLTEVN